MNKKTIAIVLVAAAITAGAVMLMAKHAYVVPVLMYHSIDDNDKMTKLTVSPANFDRQMKFFYNRRYNVVGPEKLIEYIQKKERIPPRIVCITFDDGYENNYKYAYPVLKKYGIKATIFVIINKVGQPGWLTWDEIREMSDSGLIDIESHTMSHLWLPSMGSRSLRYELTESKKILEGKLGKSVNFLCYPIGAHDDRVKDAVRAAGYLGAFGTNPGRFKLNDDIYAIKRIKISNTSNSLLVFWAETGGYYTWIKEHRG